MPSDTPGGKKQSHPVIPKPVVPVKKRDGTNVDDAQLDGVTDDSAFSEDADEFEITDENQRSESRVEPRRKI